MKRKRKVKSQLAHCQRDDPYAVRSDKWVTTRHGRPCLTLIGAGIQRTIIEHSKFSNYSPIMGCKVTGYLLIIERDEPTATRHVGLTWKTSTRARGSRRAPSLISRASGATCFTRSARQIQAGTALVARSSLSLPATKEEGAGRQTVFEIRARRGPRSGRGRAWQGDGRKQY